MSVGVQETTLYMLSTYLMALYGRKKGEYWRVVNNIIYTSNIFDVIKGILLIGLEPYHFKDTENWEWFANLL
jgi:hypothetical protein